MKTLLLFLMGLALASGQEPTKLAAGSASMKAPDTIDIPEISSLKLRNTQQDMSIKQYQIQEYWKAIQQLQEIVKKDGEVIQNLSAKILADAKVNGNEWKISEDGLKLERTTPKLPLSAELPKPSEGK